MITFEEYLKNLKTDTDVYIDGTGESCAVCVPLPRLTEEGRKHFENALKLPMDNDSEGLVVSNNGNDYTDYAEWEEVGRGDGGPLRLAVELIYSMAGYCSTSDYDKWFVSTVEG